jgi:hypothetical protein
VQIRRRVTIKAPPELIWDVITNLRRAKQWAPGFDDYPYIAPDWPARNAKAVWRYHAGLLRFDFELTITEAERGAALQIDNRSAFGRGVEVYGFSKHQDSTTIDCEARNEPNWLGRFVMPLVEDKLNQQIDATVASLKVYCERSQRVS